MSLSQEIHSRRTFLHALLGKHFRDSALQAWASARHLGVGAAPHEPDIIAALCRVGAPRIAADLQVLLRPLGFAFSITTIFCHGRPLVSHTRGTCELGDILFVHCHRVPGTPAVRRAILLQAKATTDAYTPGSGDSQLYLYLNWPDFTYINSGQQLNGVTRTVLPKQRHLGAQYLLADSRPPEDGASGLQGVLGTHCLAACPADHTLYPDVPLEHEFVRLLELTSGREFGEKSAHPTDGWSQMVWDLVTYAAAKSFARRRIGYKGVPRTSGDAVPILEGSLLTHGTEADATSMVDEALTPGAFAFISGRRDIPPPGLDVPQSNEESRGVSVFLIETREIRERRNQ